MASRYRRPPPTPSSFLLRNLIDFYRHGTLLLLLAGYAWPLSAWLWALGLLVLPREA